MALHNLARMTTATTGTGNITLGAAVSGYLTFAQAGVADGETVPYGIKDGASSEVGTAPYTASGTLLATRNVTRSTNGNAAISLSGAAEVFITPRAEDLNCIGVIEYWPTSDVPTGRLKCNGGSYNRSTYPDLFKVLVKSGTVTFTNGSANVGWTAHGRSVGDPVKLFTSGSLPTNFAAGTHGLTTAGVNYVVKAVIDPNTITLAASVAGSAITAGSAGSGTHSAVVAPHGDGDGTATFTVPQYCGEFLRGWDNGRGIDANRAIGDLQTDAFQGHFHGVTWTPGAFFILAGGSNGTGGINTVAGVSITVLGPISDGTNGTPRTATETRPRNISALVTIRYA
jgi:hypothetical protein